METNLQSKEIRIPKIKSHNTSNSSCDMNTSNGGETFKSDFARELAINAKQSLNHIIKSMEEEECDSPASSPSSKGSTLASLHEMPRNSSPKVCVQVNQLNNLSLTNN